MMLTNESVTLYHYDEDSESFSRFFFPRASVYRNILASVAESGLVMDSVIKIRIPLDGANSVPDGGSAQGLTAAGRFKDAGGSGGAAGGSVSDGGTETQTAAMDSAAAVYLEDSAGHAENRTVIKDTTAESRAGAAGGNAKRVEAGESAAINGNVVPNHAGAANRIDAVNCTGASTDGNAAGSYGAWNGAEAVSSKATVSSAGAGAESSNAVSLRSGALLYRGATAGDNGNGASCSEDSSGGAESRAVIKDTTAGSRTGAAGGNAERVEASGNAAADGSSVAYRGADGSYTVGAAGGASASTGDGPGSGVGNGVLVGVGDYVFIGKSDESKPDRASCHKVLGFSRNLRGANPHIRIEAK